MFMVDISKVDGGHTHTHIYIYINTHSTYTTKTSLGGGLVSPHQLVRYIYHKAKSHTICKPNLANYPPVNQHSHGTSLFQ